MAEAPVGGSVQQTAAVSLPTGAAMALAIYLTHPVWPPPPEILAIVVPCFAPVVHLIGRAIYRRIERWAGVDPPALPPSPSPPESQGAEHAPVTG